MSVISLSFNQHSAIGKIAIAVSSGPRSGQGAPLIMRIITCKTCLVAGVVPPCGIFISSTIAPRRYIIVPVVCRKHHSIVKVLAKFAITIQVAFIHQCITSVSAVAVHFQSIFFVELVTDLQ